MAQIKIDRLAHLAWLVIPEEKNAKMEHDLTEIITYFSILEPIDTSLVETVTTPWAQDLPLRSDTVVGNNVREWLLACSPQRVAGHQIILGSIMQTDE